LKIDKQNGLPKFFQLKEKIIGEIVAGNYPVDAKLPTERVMMAKYAVSSITVARAMRELVAEGIIVRKVGAGSYVVKIPDSSGFSANITNVPQIILCTEHKTISQFSDPCNWFIENEIRHGFVNTCRHSVKFAVFSEIQDWIDKHENIAVALFNPTVAVVQQLKQAGIRYVIIDQEGHFELGSQTIKWNQLTGIYELMAHLVKVEKHQRVGLIAGDAPAHNDRIAGYQIALHSLGVPFDESLMIKVVHGSSQDGYQAMEQLLELPELPTAVFVDTDLKAVGAMKAIVDRGLKVPEDISVIGFDDMPGVDVLEPPLTTVKAPYFEMGSVAAKLLEQLIAGNFMLEEALMLETSLVVRESTAVYNGTKFNVKNSLAETVNF
jgi:DNA-binding transcriptional regulator YhcF (GntR family)